MFEEVSHSALFKAATPEAMPSPKPSTTSSRCFGLSYTRWQDGRGRGREEDVHLSGRPDANVGAAHLNRTNTQY